MKYIPMGTSYVALYAHMLKYVSYFYAITSSKQLLRPIIVSWPIFDELHPQKKQADLERNHPQMVDYL